jgi:hypothetical protein
MSCCREIWLLKLALNQNTSSFGRSLCVTFKTLSPALSRKPGPGEAPQNNEMKLTVEC